MYLEQVFAALRRAGIVKSIKGPQGGYLLNHPAEKITVAEILEALDGTYHIADEDLSLIHIFSDGAAIAREIADITIAADNLHEIVTLKKISNRPVSYTHLVSEQKRVRRKSWKTEENGVE